MLHLRVPAGIGDISWSYSKIAHIKEPIHFQISADNPQRSIDYVTLLPNVSKAEYIGDNFHKIVDNSINPNTSANDFLSKARSGFVNFSPNRYLEAGNRLENWLPDLPTEFHYNINVLPMALGRIYSFCKTSTPLIGIYASTYQNISTWSGWHLKEWSSFLRSIHKELPKVAFVFIGAPYDKPFADDLLSLNRDLQIYNMVGETTINQAMDKVNLAVDFYRYQKFCFPDEKHFINLLRYAYTHPDIMVQKGINAAHFVRKYFSWDNAALIANERLEKIYATKLR